MNKNAYEIRLEILGLAHGDMQTRFFEKLSLLKEADARSYETYLSGKADNPRLVYTANNLSESIDALLPTSAEIIARAEELYRFIEKQ